jgi:D-amino-acid dehydrogenase
VLILLTFESPEGERARGPNVVYQPDLSGASADRLADRLRELRPDALVTRGVPDPAALAAWRAARPDSPLVVVHIGASAGLEPDVADGIAVERAADTRAALRTAERAWNRASAPSPVVRPGADRSVVLVGAGVVNLVTALHLVRHGYEVTLYDRAPDPRAGADWTAYGCTRGGGDGRMFTLTEADSYNGRDWRADGTSNDLLSRPVSADGWLLAKAGDQSEPERRWAHDFHRMPSWLADGYTEDIFAVNRAAMTGWAELLDTESDLFGEETGYREGILRLYTDPGYLRWHVERNDRLGATRRVLTRAEIRADYPALAAPCTDGTVAGGIEVVGFTVNVHRFVAVLVDRLERAGARFHWDTAVTGVQWAATGLAEGLSTADGPVRARHYLLSPGAYGNDLLRGTRSHGKIHGMLGVWLSVPNTEPRLEHSLKIAREGHRGEETNATLGVDEAGRPVLICGAGYGWTGLDPGNIDSAELDQLFDALEDTVRRFFPAGYAAARDGGTLHESRRFCVRPWTSSCLGVFERIGTTDGGALVVTGGHNTGGFAQSPVVAEAALAACEGRPHPMHSAYDPERLDRFYA